MRNEVVVGRAHLPVQRRLIDLTVCHHLETIRQGRPASRWRYDLHKYWRDTIWQRTMQDRLTREATSCSKRVAWLTRVTFLSTAIFNCQLKITKLTNLNHLPRSWTLYCTVFGKRQRYPNTSDWQRILRLRHKR